MNQKKKVITQKNKPVTSQKEISRYLTRLTQLEKRLIYLESITNPQNYLDNKIRRTKLLLRQLQTVIKARR